MYCLGNNDMKGTVCTYSIHMRFFLNSQMWNVCIWWANIVCSVMAAQTMHSSLQKEVPQFLPSLESISLFLEVITPFSEMH